MRPWSPELAGRLERHVVESAALAGNPLGDSASRPLTVYLPPSYGRDTGRRYPTVYVLQGFAASVGAWDLAPSSFEPTYPEAIDELFTTTDTPECVVCFVDAWTSVGGSQYLDAPAVGRYRSYLAEDVVGYVDATFRTLPAAAHRALQGKSSGGYGALVTAMSRPDVFGALASHAGDAAFEYSLLPLVAEAYRALRDGYAGEYQAFWDDFGSRRAFSRPADFALLICYGLSACFSPGEAVELPFDPGSGALDEVVWGRWLELDPVRMIPSHLDALAGLRAIWVDAGRSDEHFLDVGADLLSAGLRRHGIAHHHERYAGGHRGIDHRYPLALAYLATRLGDSGAGAT